MKMYTNQFNECRQILKITLVVFVALAALCAIISGLAYGFMPNNALRENLILFADAGIILFTALTLRFLNLFRKKELNAGKGQEKLYSAQKH